MTQRRAKAPPISSKQVRALLRKADKLCSQSATVRAKVRAGLIAHFQQAAAILPVVADKQRRARLSRKAR